MNIFISIFVNAIFGGYYLTHSLGWSVVLVTLAIRMMLLPLVLPGMKAGKKMREIQPKLKKLSEKYGKDREGLAKAQMQLYKEEGINPLSGCLPNILQIAVLLVFFSAFNMVTTFFQGKGDLNQINSHLIPAFRVGENFKYEAEFLGSNLALSPATIFGQGLGLNLVLPIILLIGAGVMQFLSAKLMMPSPKIDERVVEQTKDKEDDMMAAMRTQSLYVMPLMTVVLGWNFSLGILLYWFVNSAVMLGQQVASERLNS
jgi:YidC/Oxa1 family membrane protein insertase